VTFFGYDVKNVRNISLGKRFEEICVRYVVSKDLLEMFSETKMETFTRTTWETGVTFPSNTEIFVMLKTTPTKKQWKSTSERWIAELDKNSIYIGFDDRGVVTTVKIPEKQNISTDDKLLEAIQGAVRVALQKDCYEKIDKILTLKLKIDKIITLKSYVKKLKQEYEAEEDNLREQLAELRILADYLDADNNLEDENRIFDCDKGAVE
jgi:hypothetical protein